MIKILNTLWFIFRKEYDDSSDFAKGFKACLFLLAHGIKKHPQYNLNLRQNLNEKEVKRLKQKAIEDENTINLLRGKIDERTIGSHTLNHFREYDISTVIGEFTIVTNLDAPTLQMSVVEFATKEKFGDLVEGKAKLISFINSKKHKGFQAFKNKDQFGKDYTGDLKIINKYKPDGSKNKFKDREQ